METIKKYIYAIQRRLPAAGKEDIAKEITSLIYDELEGEFGKKDEYTESETEQVIKEMGHPSQVAARYRGEQPFIGSELFPIYKLVLAIASGGVTLGLLITFIIKILSEAADYAQGIMPFLDSFGQFLGGWISALLSLVGSVTIVFALIQRFGKFDSDDMNIYEDWKPKDLPELPERKDRVHRAEPIIAMCFIIIAFVLLNFYVTEGNLPFMINPDAGVVVLPVFSIAALAKYLPLWNLSLGLSFMLQLILLIKARRTLATKLFDIGITLLGIFITASMIYGPMIISMDGIIHEFGYHLWMDNVEHYYYLVLKVSMGFAIFGVVVNVIKTIVQQARKVNV